jgi:sugar diacid utilization regulator
MEVDTTTGTFDPAFSAFARLTGALETTTSIDDLLRVVALEVAALVGVRRCSIHLRDEDGELFRGRVGIDGDHSIDAHIRRTLAGIPADGVTLELLRTRRPVVIANAAADPRMIKATVRSWDIHSLLAVPMLSGGDVIGIIHLDDVERSHVFSAADAELASVFAHLAAVAVTQAKSRIELYATAEAAQRQVDALRRAAAVEERMSGLVLAGSSLQTLVEALARMMGKPCAVHDGELVRLAASAPGEGGDGMRPRLLESPCVDVPAVREALEAGRDGLPSGRGSRAFLVGPLPEAGVLHRYLVAPIAVGGEVWGWLVVMEHKRRFTGDDMLAMRRAATVLALHLSSERRAAEADWDAGASLTAELLTGCTDPATARRRAERLGVKLDAPRVVALIGSRTGPSRAGDFRAVLAAFREVAPEATVQAAAATGGVAAIVGMDGERDDEALLRAVRDAVVRVGRRLVTGADVVAGLSSVCCDPGGYADAYAEAREVVECIRRYAPGPGPDVFAAADLGAGRVLLATSDREAVCRFAEATFGTLVRDASKADLLATLRSFFDNMASIRRCAVRLGVHENTIRYRLARIEELTGMPVTHDPDAQLRARLSMLVLMLQGRVPTPVDASCEPAGEEPSRGAARGRPRAAAAREPMRAGAG